MRKLSIVLLLLVVAVVAVSRTRTTQSALRSTAMALDTIAMLATDTVPEGVDPHAITIKGYSKRAGDKKESFLITNNTNHRISQIRLRLRYTTLDNKVLHQRDATIDVVLNAGETRMVAIRSWDVQRAFYYYAGMKPRKNATPYKASYLLLGYAIAVGEF